eukprot:645232-Pleurochrysis_carterae.AAC.1
MPRPSLSSRRRGGDTAHSGREGAPRLAEAIDEQTKELSARSQNVAKERQELAGRCFRCKELQAKNPDYQVRSDHKLFDVEPMAAEIKELNAEKQRLRDEITELKGITEPGKEYFHRDCFTLAVNLAIAEATTTAHCSRNQ